jgi:hypothetical protein
MLSMVRGIVSSPMVRASWRRSQSIPARTTSFPSPCPCISGRTASGPIHPSAPERCATLNAATSPRSPRQSMAPSCASSIA